METMEEFDLECPMVKRFCQQMSEDEFEQQGLTYTQQALQELFSTMERQPELCERVVRKQKQAKLEKGPVGVSIKAKFFSVVEGKLNRCNTVGSEELQDRVRQLCAEMEKVQAYAQEAKCTSKRASRRLAEKRGQSLTAVTGQEKPSTPLYPGAPPPGPPPPPPPPLPPASGSVTPVRNHASHQQVAATPDILCSYGLSRLNRPGSFMDSDTPKPEHRKKPGPHLDIHTELLAYNPAKKLKATAISSRSPGGTPTARQPIRNHKRSPVSAFNTALITKFRNAQSPPADPEVQESHQNSDSDDGFVTPPDSP
ncbi:mitochondrial fission regulator 2 [Arapaima gigas]